MLSFAQNILTSWSSVITWSYKSRVRHAAEHAKRIQHCCQGISKGKCVGYWVHASNQINSSPLADQPVYVHEACTPPFGAHVDGRKPNFLIAIKPGACQLPNQRLRGTWQIPAGRQMNFTLAPAPLETIYPPSQQNYDIGSFHFIMEYIISILSSICLNTQYMTGI